MLRIAIPKGSLQEGAFRLFEMAEISIRRKSNRGYLLAIDDPRISEALLLRPQEIARYVMDGEFDLGITGCDWVRETEAVVQEVTDLKFSKRGWSPVKIVLATNNDNEVDLPKDIRPDAKIVTEYPRLTKRYFRNLNKRKVKIRMSHGATEGKVPRLADYLVDITETGETLKLNNMKIIDTILVSSTKLIANKASWENDEKRAAIEDIALLLKGVIKAIDDKALIKMNIPKDDLKELMVYIPALRPPTISSIYIGKDQQSEYDKGFEWIMVETVVRKSELNVILPNLRKLGARDILELSIAKMIP
ncbi:ATP phosphoribosyltransferase [bacterium]|nr:ATP phosphoribosyltransferase [bacterium]